MKNFFKNLFTNILAFFIAIFLLLFILIIGIAAIASTDSGKDIKIEENSVLTLSFHNQIIDHDTQSQISIFEFNSKQNLRIQDILNAIEKAKTDDNIKGISIETDFLFAGATQLEDLRKSLEEFKKTKKFVYAYGNNVNQAAYYLGSVADQYFLNPAGGIELKGMAIETTFFKEFADKYGIGLNVIRHGKFKAAVEPFFRNDMSPENREQITTLLDDIWTETSSQIMKSRKLNQDEFNTIVDSLYGVIPDLSLKHRLADKLVQKSEYKDFIKSKLNISKNDNLNQISISDYIETLSETNLSTDKIGVLYAAGTIYNGKEFTNIHSEKYVQYIKDLAEDDDIKAVVLRVNSPGGSANASDEILFELQQLKQKKPLIVSFGDYAASGGYYISMAADKIYAQNKTITGSIGVFGMIPDIKKLAQNQGIHYDIVSTNANSSMFSPISGITPGTLNILHQSVQRTYKRFIHFVAQNRKMTTEQVDKIGEGRVWSGKRAKEIGLVDEIGNLNDAIKFAAKKAKLNNYQVENYPAKMDKLQQFFSSLEEENIAAKYIKKQIGEEHYSLFQLFSNPQPKNSVQMILPYQLHIK